MNRWKAAGLHLLLSIAVIGGVALYVFTVWFPPALLPMSGIAGLVLLIFAVDVTLGPLLTLVVFKPGKPSLRFDLTVIAILQLGMLAYGLNALAMNRPVFLVASIDRLHLVAAQDLADADLQAAAPAWRRLSWTGPVKVGAQLPSDPAQREGLLFDSLAGRDIHAQPRFYMEFDKAWPGLLERAQPLHRLAERATDAERRRLEKAVGATAYDEWQYLPVINARGGAALMLVDPRQQPGAFVAIDPWAVMQRRQ